MNSQVQGILTLRILMIKTTSIDSIECAKLCMYVYKFNPCYFQKTKKHLKYLITEPFYACLAGILLQKRNIEFVTIAKRKKALLLSANYHLKVAIERCSAK